METIKIKELLRNSAITNEDLDTKPFELGLDSISEIEDVSKKDELEICLDDNIKPLEVAEIHDEHGRLSDAISTVMTELGISVVPFEMIDIANEVVELKAHDIFELAGRKYAVSSELRTGVLKNYQDSIIKTLSTGLPYKESLITKISYDGSEFSTLALSPSEYSYIMSLFRLYKEKIYVADNDLIMEIFCEKAEK